VAEGGAIAIRLRVPSGGTLGVAWDPVAITGGESQPWRLEGELDWSEAESLRVVSASFEDGSVLGAAALRPAGAAGHGEDSVAAAMRGPDGEALQVEEALLSTEYGPDGSPRRLGLELWPVENGVPVRVAAEVESDGLDGAVFPMTFRSEGRRGSGLLHLVRGS
jgi:hypothetical protein